MRLNHLINEIVRGSWFMDAQTIDSYAPFVHSLLTRMSQLQAPQTETTEARVQYMDEDGRKIKPNSDRENQMAFINMIGPFMKYGDMCSYGAVDIVAMLHEANNNPNVSSIILYVDGPGGSANAIMPFMDFAKYKKKPVVVLADSALSLHYFAAVSVADHIIGENTVSGRFGSIGVEARFVDAQKHWEKKGYVFHTIRPDESSEKNKLYDLALAGDYDQMKAEHLSPMAIKFQDAVKAGRPNLKTDHPGVLSGKTFSTEDALKIGLIDSIGNMQSAIEMAKVLAEIRQFNK